jgi:hypothetical protein
MSGFFNRLDLFSPQKVKEWEIHLKNIQKMYADSNPYMQQSSSQNYCSASESISALRFFGYDKIDDLVGMQKSIGTGSCAALIQNYVTGIGKTDTWVPGPRVTNLSEKTLARGTVIATFWNGKYPGKDSGNHVAFYLGHNAKIIEVVEQWKGVTVKQAKAARSAGGIQFKGISLPSDQSGAAPKMTNTAEYYYVVLDKR